MMWMPLRWVKMKGFIFGFQRRVWWPKCTPASSSWSRPTSAMSCFLFSWGRCTPRSGCAAPERGGNSTLRELEALACLGTAGLLPLDLPRVTCQHTLLAERGTGFLVVLHERAGNAEADRVALARQPAAAHPHGHVELALEPGHLERLGEPDLVRGTREVVVERASVHGPLALAGAEHDTRYGALAATDGLNLAFLNRHVASIPLQMSRGSGCWPWCGCSVPA